MSEPLTKTKTYFREARVVVDVDVSLWLTKPGGKIDAAKRQAEDVKKQILRHVDGVAQAYVEIDTDIVCAYCGYDPEYDDIDGRPLCCDKAVAEWQSRIKEAAHE